MFVDLHTYKGGSCNMVAMELCIAVNIYWKSVYIAFSVKYSGNTAHWFCDHNSQYQQLLLNKNLQQTD